MANLPTIDIKGKQYVLVSERVKHFNEAYPDGAIQTELVSDYDSKLIVVKAIVIPDTAKPARAFTGYSQAVIGDGMVNKTAALENAETSAVGRALGFMGIGVVDSIASVDELNKATGSEGKYPDGPPRSDKAKAFLASLKSQLMNGLTQLGYEEPGAMTDWIQEHLGKETVDTIEDAKTLVDWLKVEQGNSHE